MKTKTMTELRMWRVEEEDGASHTIIAENDAQAAGLFLEHFIKANGDDTMPSQMPKMEQMGRDEVYELAPWGDERKIKATVYEWLCFMKTPCYLGCSEF